MSLLPRRVRSAVGVTATTVITAWVVLLGVGCSRPSDTPAMATAGPAPETGAAAPAPAAVPTGAAPAAARTPASPASARGPELAAVGINWHPASSDAEVDSAFARAQREHRPLLLYWGAKWCPPCNQLQATLFNRQDFIERSRAFVAVYVDGDKPGAQKLAGRFKVRGYPTMVLFDSRGVEVTRLPGEVDAAQYTQLLTLGMNARRPVKAVLADALAGGEAAARLTTNDWKLLAFYSWETDEQQVLPQDRLVESLQALARACPPEPPETATRLLLKSLAAAGAAAGGTRSGGSAGRQAVDAADPSARTRVLQVLADPGQSRVHMDVLTNSADDLVTGLLLGSVTGPPAAAASPGKPAAAPAGRPPGSATTHTTAATATTAITPTDRAGSSAPERTALLTAFDGSLTRLAADTSLSRADRMMAMIARVSLARSAMPGAAGSAKGGNRPSAPLLPPALLADVREHASRADRDITDGYERQAVIAAAAYLLEQAGLPAESDTLLMANLSRSHSPYTLMSALAANARRRGDNAEALRWYGAAYDKSEGPATRQQWGAAYVSALVELAPQDEARIEQVAGQLLTEAAAQPDAFHERSARSLQRVGSRLQGWNTAGAHAAALKRLQARLDAVCERLDSADPQRLTCQRLLQPPSGTAKAG